MNSCIVPKHPVYALLDDFFAETEINDVIAEYQRNNSRCSKWLLFRDYCLDDKSKSNDVMTFVLMPFVNEAKCIETQQRVHEMQPSDIKKMDTVDRAFLSYLKSEGILIFSFVFSDRKHFFAPSHNQCLQSVKETLQMIRNCYERWKKTTDNEDILKHYNGGKYNKPATRTA